MRFGGDIDAGFVEGNVERGGKVAAEGQIGVGFFAAQAVVEMGGVENQAKLRAAIGEGAQEGDGVRAA